MSFGKLPFSKLALTVDTLYLFQNLLVHPVKQQVLVTHLTSPNHPVVEHRFKSTKVETERRSREKRTRRAR